MLGLVVRKVVLSMLTKLRRDSTLENDVDVAPVPFRYFEVAISVHDSVLLPHQKWHKECGRLPSDNLQWSRWPNVSPCDGGEENLTLHSQKPRVD